jgi:hypothetical protein
LFRCAAGGVAGVAGDLARRFSLILKRKARRNLWFGFESPIVTTNFKSIFLANFQENPKLPSIPQRSKIQTPKALFAPITSQLPTSAYYFVLIFLIIFPTFTIQKAFKAAKTRQ